MPWVIDNPPFWWLVIIFGVVVFWGLCLGSFTTCVVYRVPRRLSLWRQTNGSYRSFCPECHHELQTIDLIPVFSWLAQRGRCRYCGCAIPSRYLWIEISVMVLTGLLFAMVGFTALFVIFTLMIPLLAGVISFFAARPKL